MMSSTPLLGAKVLLARARIELLIVGIRDEIRRKAERSARESIELARTLRELVRDSHEMQADLLRPELQAALAGAEGYFAVMNAAEDLARSLDGLDAAYRELRAEPSSPLGPADDADLARFIAWARQLPTRLRAIRERGVDLLPTSRPPTKQSRLCVARLPVFDLGPPLGDARFRRAEMYGDDGR